MGFSFGRDRGGKLGGPQRDNMGQAPPQAAQKWKHQLGNLRQASFFPACTPDRPSPSTPGLPVEEQGLDQRDDISAGVVSSTHDCHVQELGEGETLRLADLGEDQGRPGLA